MTALSRPMCRRPCAIHWLQLVLPLVPVTASTVMCSVGAPWKPAAIGPASFFSPLTPRLGSAQPVRPSNPSRSHTIAAAPRSMAWPMNRRPSLRSPG